MNALVRNLILLSLVSLSEAERDELLITLPQGADEWGRWLALCRHNRIEPIVSLRTGALGLEIPLDIKIVIDERAQKVNKANLLRWRSAESIFQKFKEQDIPWIVLKGNAVAELIYGSLGYKQMNDIDILVRRTDLPKISHIYAEEKLVSAAHITKSQSRLEKISHHWPPFARRDLSCVIGTHWNLVTPLRTIKLNEEGLWKRKVEASVAGWSTWRLADADFLHHLCLHLSTHKVGLREVGDIMNFARFIKKKRRLSFVEQFWRRIEEAGSHCDVYRSLSMAQSLDPQPLYEEIMERARPHVDQVTLESTSTWLENPEIIAHMRTVHVSRIEKAYALFSLVEHPAEKAKWLAQMWSHLLMPPTEDAFRMNHKVPTQNLFSALSARLKAPYRISKAFAHELGWSPFLLSIAQHHIGLASSAVRFLKKDENEKFKRLKDVASDLGIDVVALERMASLE